jgi:hypothetical protein
MGGEVKGGQDGRTHKGNTIDDIPLWTLAWTYWGFICAILTAHFRRLIFWVCTLLGFLQEDSAFLSAAVHFQRFNYSYVSSDPPSSCAQQGECPLLKEKEYFYMRYMFGRIRDCWDRPICSRPGPLFQLMGRIFNYSIYGTFTYTGEKVPGINLGSYNYLGFAENAGTCIDHVIDAVNAYGVGPAGRKIEVGMGLIFLQPPPSRLLATKPAHDWRVWWALAGTMDLHKVLEKRVANFVGKEDAVVFAMGYATNSCSLPALAGPVSLPLATSSL